MFDPEERKKKMERLKTEASQKTKLPPLMGVKSEPPETVSTTSLADKDSLWVWYFEQSESIRNRYGVKTIDGKWEVVDWALFDRLVDKAKRARLRAIWKKGEPKS